MKMKKILTRGAQHCRKAEPSPFRAGSFTTTKEMEQIQTLIKKWKYIFLLAHLFFGFITTSYAADIALKWDSSTETDIDGYKVYYLYLGFFYDEKK